jgi:hypothetical protein
MSTSTSVIRARHTDLAIKRASPEGDHKHSAWYWCDSSLRGCGRVGPRPPAAPRCPSNCSKSLHRDPPPPWRGRVHITAHATHTDFPCAAAPAPAFCARKLFSRKSDSEIWEDWVKYTRALFRRPLFGYCVLVYYVLVIPIICSFLSPKLRKLLL